MQLKHPLMGIFLRAMEDSFSTADFQMIAPVHFGLRFDKLTNSHLPWSVQVVEIHDYFHRRNITELLVTILKDARPDVSEFSLVADRMGSAGSEVLGYDRGTRGLPATKPDLGDTSSGLMYRLNENLHRINREDQISEFDTALKRSFYNQESFICLVAGTAPDRIDLLKERLQFELTNPAKTGFSYFEAIESTQLVNPKPIQWPKGLKFDHKAQLQSMVRNLGDNLSNITDISDYNNIAEILNKAKTPKFFVSYVNPDCFNKSHRILLQDWICFLEKLNLFGLRQPFPHLILFEFNQEHPPEKIDDALDTLLSDQGHPLAGLLKRIPWSRFEEVGQLKHPLLTKLPALELIEKKHMERWLKEVAEMHDKTEEGTDVKHKVFLPKFSARKKVRLDEFITWTNPDTAQGGMG